MKIKSLLAGALAALALAAPATAVENPPRGIHPSVFATQYKGCLGGLRSTLAHGFAVPGFTLFASGFGPGVNPGVHQGTVGEEEFLLSVVFPALGLTQSSLQTFCAQFR
jgi:hypothetical protein